MRENLGQGLLHAIAFQDKRASVTSIPAASPVRARVAPLIVIHSLLVCSTSPPSLLSPSKQSAGLFQRAAASPAHAGLPSAWRFLQSIRLVFITPALATTVSESTAQEDYYSIRFIPPIHKSTPHNGMYILFKPHTQPYPFSDQT